MGANFQEVGDAALAMADVLLPQWLGGRRQGHEWLGETRANGGLGNSWAVNLNTGAWLHGAGDEKGGDLVSLYAALNHIKQSAAVKEVAKQCGVGDPRVRVLAPRYRPSETPCEPIPLGAGNPKPHHELGEPVAVYRYGSAFWVLRYEGEGRKLFRPFTWRAGKWEAVGYPEPRPLYRLAELEKHPEAPVILVEGEKCADALAGVMGAYVVLTWANGANSVHKNDWQVLAGRDVLVWPDADEAGRKAAADLVKVLHGVARRVRIIGVDDRPPAWDAADAVAEGWDAARISEWARDRLRLGFDSALAATVVEEAPVSITGGESALNSWQALGLDTNEGGAPHATLANASLILQMHPDFKGRIWLDSFRGKIYHTLRGLPKQWTDADSRRVTARIQQQLKLHKLNLRIMQDAIHHAAECNERNSLTDWLDSLEWDGQPRLDTWLADTLGVEHNVYSQAIARNWPIGMVARAYVPGSKMDNMPVLEGASGLSKTTFLEVLGDPWYKSLPTAFGDKDFLQAIQGTWLIEIPDMTGFSRREHTQVLATITIRNDSYRPSFGHYVEDHPRVAVFAATSETSDYLQDARGRRRYWPLYCTDIDVDALRGQREQVFAEAVHAYREGAKWYEMPAAEADAEQMARSTPDLWTDKVLEYAENVWAEEKRTGRRMPITSSHILFYAIEMPLVKQTDVEKKRIARIMRENRWVPSRTSDCRYWIKLER